MNQIILAVAACASMVCGQGPAGTDKPNVVIFLADDQGWGDLSVHGNSQVRTPNIDSLARDGAMFDRFYVCPVCSPTRAEFLTGRYHLRGGVRGVSTGQERLNLDERTIAEAFKSAGYITGAFGKWHNGSQWPYHPNARGFDEYYGFTSGHWGEYFDPPLEHNGKPVRGSGYIVDDFTDHAIEFIERNKGRSFFCYVPFNSPHSPFAVPDEYWRRFKDKPIAMRGSDGDRETVDVTRCVLAMCENIDWNVGRVLQRLDELRLADNTIVLYFSDNGPNSVRWNGGMKGRKGSTDEGGVRVPLVMRWRGKIRAGTAVREIAGAIDLMPTLTALAGIPRVGDKPLDGRDLSPLLFGTARDWPDRTIFTHWAGKVSARTQQYRLDDAGGLFDMVADPGQTKNIAAERSEVAARLSQAVVAWRKEMLGNADTGAAKAKAKAKSQAPAQNDRPYPVGYSEFPMTPLPARDGVPHGAVKRSASAPNCSYFVNWNTLADSITWDIEVHTPGEYSVAIQYTCPEADAGSTIELGFGTSTVRGKLAPGWNPPLYTNQDTISRPPAESQMKEFRSLDLGTMRLERGRGLLTLRAVAIPGKSVMDVRQVTLTLQQAPATTARPNSAGWQAGVAKSVITPEKSVWLAGYGSKRPPDGKLHDLWMKALALEDPAGRRVVLITSDFQGVPKIMSDRVFAELRDRFKLDRSQVMFTFSHNHCGPRLGDDLIDYYPVEAEQEALVAEYTDLMVTKCVAMVGESLAKLAPASLATGEGKTTFAVNRRNNREADVPAMIANGTPLVGPVDHSVPVMTVTRPDGKLEAVLFGYACHPTTLSFLTWCGDYPGFAQLELERNHPGTTAMFVNTCGGDQNPLPRRSVELCQRYGTMLATAVEDVLKQPLKPVSPRLRTAFELIELPYLKVVSRDELTALRTDSNAIKARWAARLNKKLDGGHEFESAYPYPVHAWRLGNEMLVIGMGAETVVDYALRFKREFGPGTWVCGYADDMISYIPSRRVWEEGGYEGGSNLYEYGRPAFRWAGDIENRIAASVHKLVKQVRE